MLDADQIQAREAEGMCGPCARLQHTKCGGGTCTCCGDGDGAGSYSSSSDEAEKEDPAMPASVAADHIGDATEMIPPPDPEARAEWDRIGAFLDAMERALATVPTGVA